MDKKELIDLLDRGDLYGLLLRVGKMWATTHYPATKRLVIYVIEDGEESSTRIRIPVSTSEQIESR